MTPRKARLAGLVFVARVQPCCLQVNDNICVTGPLVDPRPGPVFLTEVLDHPQIVVLVFKKRDEPCRIRNRRPQWLRARHTELESLVLQVSVAGPGAVVVSSGLIVSAVVCPGRRPVETACETEEASGRQERLATSDIHEHSSTTGNAR